jgi:hypothetical protein
LAEALSTFSAGIYKCDGGAAAVMYAHRAMVHQMMDLHEKAVCDARASLDLDFSVRGAMVLGVSLVAIGEFEESADVWRDLLRSDPHNSDLLYYLRDCEESAKKKR